MEQYNLVRQEISQRVEGAKFTNDLMVAAATVNLIFLLVALFFAHDNLPIVELIQNIVVVTSIFLKEIPYLILVFQLTARVNDKSDELIKLLGTHMWDVEHNHTRLMLYVNAEADRISFPLAGMRLKTREVYVRIAAWVFALLVGVVKSFFLLKY